MNFSNTKALIWLIVAIAIMAAWLLGTYQLAHSMATNGLVQLAAWIAIGVLIPGVIATLWFDYRDHKDKR